MNNGVPRSIRTTIRGAETTILVEARDSRSTAVHVNCGTRRSRTDPGGPALSWAGALKAPDRGDRPAVAEDVLVVRQRRLEGRPHEEIVDETRLATDAVGQDIFALGAAEVGEVHAAVGGDVVTVGERVVVVQLEDRAEDRMQRVVRVEVQAEVVAVTARVLSSRAKRRLAVLGEDRRLAARRS